MRRKLFRMKKIIILALLLISWNTLLSSSSKAGGVNSSKVVILEYWRFENGKSSNEMIIYNPTESIIEVIFKKRTNNNSDLKSDTLHTIQRIKPNNYVLLHEISDKFRKLHEDHIQVLINGKYAGVYTVGEKINAPLTKINKGIIINQLANNGSEQPFEIIYEELNFKGSQSQNIEIVFGESKFHSVSFNKGEDYNPESIDFTNIKAEKLNIVQKDNYDLFLTSTGEIGNLKLTLNSSSTKKKLKGRLLHFRFSNQNSMGYLIFKFNYIDFGSKRKRN